MTHLDPKALEAAEAAFGKTCGGLLEGRPMANAVLAYLAALPQAVLWRYRNHDINGDPWPWSYTERRPEPGSYSEIEPLFASPTPALSREDVIEAAIEWQAARLAFIALGMNHPDGKAAFNRLSNAEDALAKAAAALSQPHSEK